MQRKQERSENKYYDASYSVLNATKSYLASELASLPEDGDVGLKFHCVSLTCFQ